MGLRFVGTGLRTAIGTSAVCRALAPVRSLVNRAVGRLEHLTRRADDSERDDRRAEAALRDSVLGKGLTAAARGLERAWAGSVAGDRAASVWAVLVGGGPLDRARTTCRVTIVAAITVLALRHVASRVEPLTWIVPVVAACLAVVVLVAIPGVRRT